MVTAVLVIAGFDAGVAAAIIGILIRQRQQGGSRR